MKQTIKALSVLAVFSAAAFSFAGGPLWNNWTVGPDATSGWDGTLNKWVVEGTSASSGGQVWTGESTRDGSKAYYSTGDFDGVNLANILSVTLADATVTDNGYLNIIVQDANNLHAILAITGNPLTSSASWVDTMAVTVYEPESGLSFAHGDTTTWSTVKGLGLTISDGWYASMRAPLGGWPTGTPKDGIQFIAGDTTGGAGKLTFASASVQAVPEPFTMLLAGGGLAAAAWRRRAHRKA